MKTTREAAEADPLVATAGGGGVTRCNSMGNPWTVDYLKVSGKLDVDLRSNIARRLALAATTADGFTLHNSLRPPAEWIEPEPQLIPIALLRRCRSRAARN